VSNVDPRYAEYLEKEYAAEARRAQEIAMANQLAQFNPGSSVTKKAAPEADHYPEPPARQLPSTAPELRKELEKALADYHQAIEHVKSFEAKLREAREAEATAVTDDSGDEKRIVKAVTESQGLQAVYSRRLQLAQEKVPTAFAAIPVIVRALAQELTNRCYALAAERVARYRTVFRPRLDLESFHRSFSNSLYSFPVDFESDLDRLIECCPDVIAARACTPRLNIVVVPSIVSRKSFTFEQLQVDLDTLKKAEEAFELESAREYDFEELLLFQIWTNQHRQG
jgi:hypothetical protein